MGVSSFLKEGGRKEDPYSLRRFLALGCAIVFWYATVRLVEQAAIITVFWVPLILAGLPFIGMLAFMFLTTWESIRVLIGAWKGKGHEEE